jgi:DNA phosphorothioation-associated putative methyltransferase
VFFVFRDEALRQTFAAARYRRSTAAPRQSMSDALFQEHRELLQGLMDFVAARGRLPEADEIDTAPFLSVFGSVRRAFALVQRVTGGEGWQKIKEERSQDLLVWLALAQFGKRPKYSALPPEMQADVKAFFGTYSRACERADELLFSAGSTEAINAACAAAPCGKLTPEALYVHTAAVGQLPPILRVYEGCARNYVGTVEGANLLKLHRLKPKVSYLSYPDFDGDPHPALAGALVVPLNSFDVKYWNYVDAANPPVLHRKEEFVPEGYPGREKFAKLTKQEERRGLYEDTSRIGRRDGWNFVLEEKQVQLRGHQLVRKPPQL